MPANTATRSRAGRREWIGLAVIALPCLLYSMDLTVLILAMPSITAALRPSSTQLLWIVDIYGFLLAGSLITMGTLGDRIGRRRLLLIGATAFGLASMAAAFSTSTGMLIVARGLLGIAAATLAPSTLSLIRNMFLDPRQRTIAISIMTTSFSVGAAVGPLLGGLLLQRFWWGSVFLLAVPVMTLLLVLGPVLLPEYRDPRPGRLDLVSAFLSVAAVLPVIYGIKQWAQDGPGWPSALSILAGLAVGIVFLRRQRTVADPLLDLRLFRAPAFSGALAINLVSPFVGFSANLFIAQYLQLVLALSPLWAGLWMVPSTAGFILSSLLVPLQVRRVRPAYVIAAGLVLAAAGFGVLAQVDRGPGLALLVTGSVVVWLGLAPAITLAIDMVVGAARPERAGAAAAISETGFELGGALGLGVLGSVGAAVYRGRMAHAVPAAVPAPAAAAARDSLGSAAAAAAHLPGQLGATLLDTAREAFTQGLHLTALISAAVLVGIAILSGFLLRRVSTASNAEDQPDQIEAGQRAPAVGSGAS
jgi:MFS transporter, DHA2 family, multidrug resistance protein